MIAASLIWLGTVCIKPVRADVENTGVDTDQGETLTTNPKSRTVNVSASVSDLVSPSVPILVAPPDTATLVTSTPRFIWKESSDERGIDKYQLWLDGALYFNNIPTNSTVNDSYTLVYEDGEYKLTTKLALSQGSHTWYIVAYDPFGNHSQSATWSFNIDTQSPVITVTSIDDLETQITSANSASVPTLPLELTGLTPILTGTGESGTTISLTVTIPGQSPLTLTLNLQSANFAFQLPTLPSNQVIYLSLVSSDGVGNTSTITNIPIIIKPTVITLPIPKFPLDLPLLPPETILTTPFQIISPTFFKEFLYTLPAPMPTLVTIPRFVRNASFIPILVLILVLFFRKVRSIVCDTKNGAGLAGVKLFLSDLKGDQIVTYKTDDHGWFDLIIPTPGDYKLTAELPGYFFSTAKASQGGKIHTDHTNQERILLIPMDQDGNTNPPTWKHRARVYIHATRRRLHPAYYPLLALYVLLVLLFPTLLNLGIALIFGSSSAMRQYSTHRRNTTKILS